MPFLPLFEIWFGQEDTRAIYIYIYLFCIEHIRICSALTYIYAYCYYYPPNTGPPDGHQASVCALCTHCRLVLSTVSTTPRSDQFDRQEAPHCANNSLLLPLSLSLYQHDTCRLYSGFIRRWARFDFIDFCVIRF